MDFVAVESTLVEMKRPEMESRLTQIPSIAEELSILRAMERSRTAGSFRWRFVDNNEFFIL